MGVFKRASIAIVLLRLVRRSLVIRQDNLSRNCFVWPFWETMVISILRTVKQNHRQPGLNRQSYTLKHMPANYSLGHGIARRWIMFFSPEKYTQLSKCQKILPVCVLESNRVLLVSTAIVASVPSMICVLESRRPLVR